MLPPNDLNDLQHRRWLWLGVPVALVLGCMVQIGQASLLPLWAPAAAALAAGLGLWRLRHLRRRQGRVPVLGAVLLAALLAWALTEVRAQLIWRDRLAPSLEGQDLLITGTVDSLPQVLARGQRFVLRTEQAHMRSDGRAVSVPQRLQLSWYHWGGSAQGQGQGHTQAAPASLQVRAGQRWTLQVRLRQPHGLRNPHSADRELWLWERGLGATGYVRDAASARLLAQTRSAPWAQARQQARERIHAQVQDRSLAGVLSALVAGDQAAIERADWQLFRATGVAHLMSISGLHITMFAWLAMALLGWLWRRWPAACLRLPAQVAGWWGGLLLATAYAAFAGWGLPAQRTVCMLAVATLLRSGASRWPWPMVWLLALAVVTLGDPWGLLQPGFWLSFVAVGVLMASAAGEPTRDRPASQFGGGNAVSAGRGLALVAEMLARLWREQWVITLVLAPLGLLWFHQLSLVGLLANALAIPWVTWVVTPLAMLGLLWPALWSAAALALQAIMQVLGWLGALPWAVLSLAAPPAWMCVVGVLGGLMLARRGPAGLRLMGLPLLLPALLWQPARPAHGEYEVLALDIGQGSAVLVRTAKHSLLYDAGPGRDGEYDAGQAVVVPLLDAMGERLDKLVLSHPDADHVGGAASVITAHPQAEVLGVLGAHPLAALPQFRLCSTGDARTGWVWDGVRFDVLHPGPQAHGLARPGNAQSCVLRVDSGQHAALLTGDIDQGTERALLAADKPLRADLLLLAHHGSRLSNSVEFLHAVGARWAVAQAGYGNAYGHPAAEVQARVAQAGTRFRASPACGAALWRSEAPEKLLCERERGRRYWHWGN